MCFYFRTSLQGRQSILHRGGREGGFVRSGEGLGGINAT